LQELPRLKDLGIPNVGETYRGQILICTSDVRPAIIKDIPSQELANEVLATALVVPEQFRDRPNQANAVGLRVHAFSQPVSVE